MNKSIISLFLFHGLIFMPLLMKSQQIKPDYYWNFEGSSPKKATIGKSEMRGETFTIEKENGINGSFIRLTDDTRGPIIMNIGSLKDAFSVEFWVRFSPKFNSSTRLVSFFPKMLDVYFSKRGLNFKTLVKSRNGEIHEDFITLDLRGSGLNRLGYFLDQQWHHFVFKYNAKTGKKEMWIDGRIPENGSKTVEIKGQLLHKKNGTNQLGISYQNNSTAHLLGDMDQLRVYHSFIPQQVHNSNFNKEKKNLKKASDSSPRAIPNPNAQTIGFQIDRREYPAAHPNVKISPLDQLKAFPGARYKPGHSLRPNFNWMGASYIAGSALEGVSKKDAITASVAIQKELAENWNYMLAIQDVSSAKVDRFLYNDDEYLRAFINLANENPHLPLGLISHWGGMRHNKKGIKQAMITRQDLDDHYYLRNARGQFINKKGELTKRKEISLAAPEDFCEEDGKLLEYFLDIIIEELTRPIDLINENGEVVPLPLKTAVSENVPDLVAHKNRLGINDWSEYQSKQKTRLREAYFSQAKNMPQLKNTIFSWYAVDGGPESQNRFEWKEARKIGTKFNGQYYSTPDFYPRQPDNWEKWQGAWHGWEWINITREEEIKLGDKLFSPFVAAGWSKNPEATVRPSQWLGLLKNLGVVGAEFYYTGFFNVGKGKTDFPDPRNYVWQAIIPPYAQAITSHYEEILRNGNVLFDNKGKPIIRHDAGDPRILVTIRKHDQKEIYVIAGNINPYSNALGNVDDEKIATVNLNGRKLNFNVRRQGSVYYYDATNSAKPVFYQLDEWHEIGHPSRWTKDFIFNAEVFDEAKNMKIITQKPNLNNLDFTEFESFIAPEKNKGCAEYSFALGEGHTGKFDFALKARSGDGKKTGVSIFLDNKKVGELSCIQNQDWKWLDHGCHQQKISLSISDKKTHILEIRTENGAVEIDEIKLMAR